MGVEEIKKSFENLQREYNRLCGLRGHILAQMMELEEQNKTAIIDQQAVIKRIKNLEANMPKEQPAATEENNESVSRQANL